jgi:hypothetical protein
MPSLLAFRYAVQTHEKIINIFKIMQPVIFDRKTKKKNSIGVGMSKSKKKKKTRLRRVGPLDHPTPD